MIDRASCLRELNLPSSASIADIKSAFKMLAKKYHPDIDKSDGTRFIRISAAYDYLNSNNSSTPPPTPRPEPEDRREKFFFIFKDGKLPTIDLPYWNTITEDIIIHCMRFNREFNIKLNKGTILPKALTITNIERVPFKVMVMPSRSWPKDNFIRPSDF